MIVKSNQSVFDVVTQHNGDVRAAIYWCLANGKSITDSLSAGVEMKDVETDFDNNIIQDYFINKGFELATADVEVEGRPEGVGYWFIENDFSVTVQEGE